MCTIQLSWCIPFRGRNGTAVTIISLAVKWTFEIDPVAHVQVTSWRTLPGFRQKTHSSLMIAVSSVSAESIRTLASEEMTGVPFRR